MGAGLLGSLEDMCSPPKGSQRSGDLQIGKPGSFPHLGLFPQAGFNSGTAQDYFNIPGSRTSAIIHIMSTSNVGIPGLWAFRTDKFTVPNGCIYKGEWVWVPRPPSP